MIKWKGIEFRNKGIIVEKTPTISKAKKKINVYEIDGRNGFLSIDTEKYESFVVEVECHYHESANKDDIKAFLDGYGTLSFDGEREYTAIIQNAIPFEKVMHFKRFIVQFLVNPICEDIEESYNIISTEIQTITGNNISLVNSNIKDIELLGDTEQTIYSGKNKFKMPEEQVINGLTITHNTDGSVKINGTTNAITQLTLNTFSANGNYTWFYEIISGSTTGGSITSRDINTNTNYIEKSMVTSKVPTTFNVNNVELQNRLYIGNGTTFSNLIFKIQIEEGLTATTYEPYVGGIPSPNPDYPQEINNVTGRQVIDVIGKNLLVPYNGSNVGVDIFTNDYTITVNGTSTGSSNFAWSSNFYLKAGTYRINTKYVSGTINNNIQFIFRKYNSNDNLANFSFTTNSYQSDKDYTFTLDEDTYIRYTPYIGGSGRIYNNFKFNIQMTTSDNADYNFEPYKGQSYEINLGKNLFDKDNANIENAYLKTDGTTQASSSFRVSDYIDVCRFSNITISGNGGNSEVNCFYDKDKNFLTYFATGTNATITAKVPSNAKYLRCTLHSNVLNQYQVEEGSQATSYSEYFTPIELCNINNNRDRIRKSTGKNLFDKDNANYINAFITTDTNKFASSSTVKTYYISCEPNTTYTISKILGNQFRVGTSNVIPVINGSASQTWQNNNATQYTITTDSNANYLCICIRNSSTDTLTEEEILNSIQIEENSTATDLEPYGVGKWYIYNKKGKVVLDGSEDWEIQWNTTDVKGYRVTLQNMKVSTDLNSKIGMYSSHFIEFTQNELSGTSTTNGISARKDNSHVIVKKQGISSLANFITWLSSNNIELEYPLATPTIEEITSTNYPELYNQLIELDNMYTYDGVSNIMSTLELELEYIPKYQELAIEGGNYTIYPVLEITSVGDISITINNQTFYLYNTNGTYILDSKNQVITKDGINESSSMLGNFPTLENIANKVSYTGNVSSFKVIYKKSYL